MKHLHGILFAALALHAPGAFAAQAAPTITTATRGPVTRSITIPGELAPNLSATLYAKAPGFLKTIAVDKGDFVKAGDLLAELESPELTSDLDSVKVRVEIARRNMERLREAGTADAGAISPMDLDNAKAELATAEAALSRTQTLLVYLRITAPFDGVVTARYADPGAFIPAATGASTSRTPAVLALADTGKIRLRVSVPEEESLRVGKGSVIRFSVPALPGRTFEAAVSRTAFALDEHTRTLLVEADVPNATGSLRPGMYASVSIVAERREGALSVPAGAVFTDKSGDSVFVAVGGLAKKTRVKTGFRDAGRVEILDGIAEGDSAVLFGSTPPTDGAALPAAKL